VKINSLHTPIFVAGLGYTGSSAVIDLLREFEGVFVFESEFRLFVDPGGLISLRDSIVENWSIFQTDKAIKDYKLFVNNINKRFRGSYSTLGHSKYFDGFLLEESERFLNHLTELTYKGLWYGIDNIVKRQLNKYALFYRKGIVSENIYVGKQLSEHQFNKITDGYIDNLMKYCLNKYSSKQFIFNENFSCMFIKKILKMVNNSKMIVVIRDPRDVFATTLKAKWCAAPGMSKEFVVWEYLLYNRWLDIFEMIQQNSYLRERVLVIKFEDLVREYENTKVKILKFAQIHVDKHANSRRYFIPEKSSANIGLHKQLIDNNTSQYFKEKFRVFYDTFNYKI